MNENKYTFIIDSLTEEVYSRTKLFDLIYRFYPAYSESSCNWIIGSLVACGALSPLGGGFFAKPKKTWSLPLGKADESLLRKLRDAFPVAEIAALPSEVVNSMVEMDGGDEFFLIEISKRDLFPCYMKIRDLTKRDVLITPTAHELSFYMKPDAIILKPLFSKSPIAANGAFTLEKLLVDLFCDKTISILYPGVDFCGSVSNILKEFNVNLTTLLNYAKRRKILDAILPIVKQNVSVEIWQAIGGKYDD